MKLPPQAKRTIFAIPLARIAMPLARFAMPLARIAMPLARIAMPLARIAMPLARFAIAILSLTTLALYIPLIRLGYLPPLPSLLSLICLNNCNAKETLHTSPTGEEILNNNQPISQIIGASTIDKSQTSILIEKSQYRLTLYYNYQPIKDTKEQRQGKNCLNI